MSDAALIALGRDLETAWAQERDLERKAEARDQAVRGIVTPTNAKAAMLDAYEKLSPGLAAVYDRCEDLARQIEACRATTLAGLRVKARAVQYFFNGQPVDFGAEGSSELEIATSIIRDLLDIEPEGSS